MWSSTGGTFVLRRGGWPLMLRLQPGDIVFHYNSHAEAVLGISRVVNIGQHKGSATSNPSEIAGTRCIRYHGEHLSKDHFSAPRRRYLREKYPTYYEVHTDPLLEGRLGKLLARTPQAYLLSIDSTIAERFLIANAVELRGSSKAANSP